MRWVIVLVLAGTLWAQQVFDVQAVYPPGQTAAKTGDYVWITAKVLPVGGVDSVWLNANSIGGPSHMLMYDDGDHHDGLADDGVWGSDSILVDTVGTAYHTVTVYARSGTAPVVSNRGVVGVDNQRPFVSNVNVIYPEGQSALKYGDQFRITAYISDVRGYVDVVLGMDNSSSMCDTVPGDTISKWRAAELAAFSFLDNLEENDRAAFFRFYNVSPFGTEESLTVAFTEDKELVKDSIDASDPPCPSGMGTALYDMIVEAANYARTSPNIPAVIIMTDGIDTWSDEYTREDCYYLPVPVFTIGFGDTTEIDEAFLDSVATTSAGGKYYYAPSAEELDSIYQEIAYIIASWEAPKGISEAWVDATPFGGPSKVLMYDDGEHGDGAPGDTIYGSGLITLYVSTLDTIRQVVQALDVAYNTRQDTGDIIYVDNVPPLIFDSLRVTYPSGRNDVHNGEKVFFTLGVQDTGFIGGIEIVYLDATQIGGPPQVIMRDDGTGNDTLAGDGIYTSDSITVYADGFSGTAAVYAYAKDIAYNTVQIAGGVLIDNVPPEISNVTVIYPEGQNAAKAGDRIRIEALITDGLSGVDDTTVILNSFNIDGSSHIMVDDGTNGDRVAGDNVYTAEIWVTSTTTGEETFTITAKDMEGNQAGPVEGSVILDNEPPQLYAIDIEDPDDIYKNGDVVTLRITADSPGYRIAVDFSELDRGYVSGAEVVSDNGDGTYTVSYEITPSNTTPDGVHTVTVVATDSVGLADSGTVDLVLDNTKPVVDEVGFVMDPGQDLILNSPDTLYAIFEDERGIVEAQFSIDGPGGPSYSMVVDNPGADSTRAHAYFDISSLSDGVHRVYVSATDSAGNVSDFGELVFTKDATGPQIDNIEIVYPEGQTGVRDGQFVKITAHIVDLTTSVNASSVRLDATYLNGNPNFPMRDDGTGGDDYAGDNIYTALIEISTGLNGPQPFVIRASDIVPNQIVSDTGFVMLDNEAPVISGVDVLDPDNIYRNGETVHLLLTTGEAGLSVSADFSPIDSYYLEGSEVVEDNGDGTYDITYTIKKENTRADGDYWISVTVEDGVGYQAQDSVLLVLDNTSPLTYGLDFVLDPLNDNILNAPDTLIAIITDSTGIVAAEYFIDVIGPSGSGTSMILDNPGAALVTAKAFIDVTSLSQGEHTLFVHGQDSSGTWGSYESLTFTYDSEPPVIENVQVIYPDGQSAVRDGQEITIMATVRDLTTQVDPLTVFVDATYLNGEDSLQLYDDGTHGDLMSGDNIYTRRFVVTTGLTGMEPFTVSASDIVPNTLVSDTAFVVLDNTNPVISSVDYLDPDNIYRNGETIKLELVADASGYSVSADFSQIDINYITGSENVEDRGDGSYAITYTISTTNTRPNGFYTVTLIVTDGVGLKDTATIALHLDNSGPRILSMSLDDPDDTLNQGDTLRITAFDSLGVVALEYFIDNTGVPGTGTPISNGDQWGADTVNASVFISIDGLSEGLHTLYVDAKDSSGNWGAFESLTFLVDTKAPLIQDVQVTYPEGQNAVSKGQSVVITALIKDVTTQVDPDSVFVDVSSFSDSQVVWMHDDGEGADEVAGDDIYTALVVVTSDSSGEFDFVVHASDVVPNHGQKVGSVILDNIPPSVSIEIEPTPEGDSLHGEVYEEEILLRGFYFDLPDSGVEHIVEVYVTVKNPDGEDIMDSPIEIPVEDRDFTRLIRLVEGTNIIRVFATDWAGLTMYDSAVVEYVVPEISMEIGPEGGVIEAPDGARITIPEGALNSTVEIKIEAIEEGMIPPADSTRLHLLREAHRFSPDGLVFLKPVEITLPYTEFALDPDQDDSLEFDERRLTPYFFDGNTWLKAGEPVRDTSLNRVTFTTNHLSIYSLGVEVENAIKELRAGWTRNPFRLGENSTFIFELPEPGKVTLRIVDLSGDVVREIVKEKVYSSSGRYNLQWDGLGDFNRGTGDLRNFPGSGIYIYIFEFEGESGEKVVIRKPIGVLK